MNPQTVAERKCDSEIPRCEFGGHQVKKAGMRQRWRRGRGDLQLLDEGAELKLLLDTLARWTMVERVYKLWPLYSRPASSPESQLQCAQSELLQQAHEVQGNSTRLTSFLCGLQSNSTLDSHIAYHITENGEFSSPILQSQRLNTEKLPPFPWPLLRPLTLPTQILLVSSLIMRCMEMLLG